MIKIIDGNLFDTKADIILHQVNAQGKFNSGVAYQVRQRYPHVYRSYLKDYIDGKLKLGYVNFTTAKDGLVIANMCAQNNYGYDGKQYTDYYALQECLNRVLAYCMTAYDIKPTIALPWRMSCDRGGGNWDIVQQMIEETFKDFNVEVWRLKEGE